MKLVRRRVGMVWCLWLGVVTHIVMGRSQRPWYWRWFGQSVLDRLLRTIPGVDVLVVDSS